MNKFLLPISGAFLAATVCFSPTASAEDVQIEQRTTTTTTGPAIVEKPVLTDEEKDRLEDRIEADKEAREKIDDAIKDRNEEVADEMEDALDD